MSEKIKPIKKLHSFEAIDPKDNKVRKFFLRNPTTSIRRAGELFNYKKLNQAIKEHGLLPTVLISKRFENDDGILSKQAQSDYDAAYLRLGQITKELALLEETKTVNIEKKDEEILENAAAKVGKTLEDIKDAKKDLEIGIKEKLIKEREDLRRTLQNFETNKTSLFNISAESWARNQTILWWVLHLSYSEDDQGNPTPFYSGDTYEQKLEKSDEYEDEEDLFISIVVKKFLFFVSFWFYSGSVKSEDFEKAEKDFNI